MDHRKVKMFSIFLLCSFSAWFVNKLSEPYESGTTFDLNYENLPDTLLISKGLKNQLEAKVSTNGFQFLYHNFNRKIIDLDVSKLQTTLGKFYFPKNLLEKTIRRQLSSNIKLVDIYHDTLFLNVFKVKSKEIPIKPTITLTLEQNHLMNGTLTVKPHTIVIKGPETEIDSIQEIKTEKIELLDLYTNFSVNADLLLPNHMINTVMSAHSVQLSGTVVKFSEKVFQANIQVLNVPNQYRVKTFPNSISVLCKASIEHLKAIDSSDFQVIADYQDRVDDKMFLNIKIHPTEAYDVRLLENQVNFILEKQ